jgi:hypothetical protein
MNINSQTNTLKMKELIKLQNESNENVVKEYCLKAQYQNMVMNKLKYHRNVYA